ncbi:protein phosphatase 1 regulatory subunit 27-like [Tubulanus polymorphus]|uniref:protein phosphatase 1 regulatory subunit 27-like n=1 Tax=Tubulanus polymorphus TaxID=672921 RepID=UPI003DA47FAC
MSTSQLKRRISFPADAVLHAVVQEGDIMELLRILESGTDININQKNHVGLTALHQGVLANNLDAVKILLCYGADVNMQDIHGVTPLHAAAGCGFILVASFLLLFGGNLFIKTNDGDLAVDLSTDVKTATFLAEQMCSEIHKQMMWQSWIIYQLNSLLSFFKHKLKELFSALCILVQSSMNGIAQLILQHRETSNSEVCPSPSSVLANNTSQVVNNNRSNRPKLD